MNTTGQPWRVLTRQELDDRVRALVEVLTRHMTPLQIEAVIEEWEAITVSRGWVEPHAFSSQHHSTRMPSTR